MLDSVNRQSSPARSQNENRSKPARLPQELVDDIISYVDDDYTLFSCSMTCRSLRYSARLPPFYSLTSFNVQGGGRERVQWPIPLQEGCKLDSLPFVRRLYIRTTTIKPSAFTSDQLRGDSLRHFSALKNLRELWVDNLKLSDFIPHMKQYFGHLESTLQSLALNSPEGSCRTILYFIGFFPKLQDLKLLNFRSQTETTGSSALVPPSRPPLHGWLRFESSEAGEFVNLMTALHGGLRFRHVELLRVPADAQRILDACVETLETFQLCSPRWGSIHLFRHESIKTLKFSPELVTRHVPPELFMDIFPKTPLPLNLVIVYEESHFEADNYEPGYSKHDLDQMELFELLRRVYNVNKFQLVLCAEVPIELAQYAKETLARGVRTYKHMCGKSSFRALLDVEIISRKPRMGCSNWDQLS